MYQYARGLCDLFLAYKYITPMHTNTWIFTSQLLINVKNNRTVCEIKRSSFHFLFSASFTNPFRWRLMVAFPCYHQRIISCSLQDIGHEFLLHAVIPRPVFVSLRNILSVKIEVTSNQLVLFEFIHWQQFVNNLSVASISSIPPPNCFESEIITTQNRWTSLSLQLRTANN